MIIYNTTFHIHRDVREGCLAYLKNSYIPKAIQGGILRAPSLMRVLNSENEEGESFSLQFHVQDVDALNQWLREVGKALQQELIGRYQENVVGFSTLLEEMDLPR